MQQEPPLRRPQAVALGPPTPLAVPLTPHRGPQAAALEAHQPLTQLLQVRIRASASLTQALHCAACHAALCLYEGGAVTRGEPGDMDHMLESRQAAASDARIN